jgi:hypothetical protein
VADSTSARQDVALAWMVSRLTDQEGGSLLNIDLEAVKMLRDRRRPWGRQGEHPSRWWFEFQETRNLSWWNMPKSIVVNAIWKDCVQVGDTHEQLHHSVHVGHRYDLSTSPQFKKLRVNDQAKLRLMWEENRSETKLGETEKLLLWRAGDPLSRPDSAYMGRDDSEVHDLATDPQVHLTRPGYIPKAVWKVAAFTAKAPIVALATIMNCRPIPSENLKPGILVLGLARLQSMIHGRQKRKTA